MKRSYLGSPFINLVFLLAFLLAPPALRLAIHSGWIARAPQANSKGAAANARHGELIALLEDRLRKVNRDLQLVTSAKGLLYDPAGGAVERSAARYRVAVADGLPLSTPSSAERYLFISFRGLPALRKDSTVLYEDRLVGRLVDSSSRAGAGRVQSILDPLFRARFRCGEDTGMLWGTGRTDRDGYPLLEIRHLGKTPSFSEGQAVLTEGGDGLYPAGCIEDDQRARGSDVTEAVLSPLRAPGGVRRQAGGSRCSGAAARCSAESTVTASRRRRRSGW